VLLQKPSFGVGLPLSRKKCDKGFGTTPSRVPLSCVPRILEVRLRPEQRQGIALYPLWNLKIIRKPSILCGPSHTAANASVPANPFTRGGSRGPQSWSSNTQDARSYSICSSILPLSEMFHVVHARCPQNRATWPLRCGIALIKPL